MISIKNRPRHLSVIPKSVRNNYPLAGFCHERIIMIAELDDRNIEFDITLLRSVDTEAKDVKIVGEVPSNPERGTSYLIGERNDVISKIGNQMDVIRRSNKSDILILDWLSQRVIEYANSCIL